MQEKSLKIGYLTSIYPAASHTFIRREILELERRGHSVIRTSLRHPGNRIADPTDFDEMKKTHYCLQKPGGILGDMILVFLSRPIRFLKALSLAFTMAKVSERGFIKHLIYLVEASHLYRYMKSEKVRHIHVHFGQNSATVARLIKKLGGLTYSITIHGPGEFDAAIGNSLSGKIKDAEFIAAITNYCKGQLFRWCGPDQWNKIHVIRCGLDGSFFSPVKPVIGNKTFVCVGRLTPQKGQLILLESIKLLKDEGFTVKLILCGDGEMRGIVESTIRELELEELVTITGWISSREVHEHLDSCSAMILPSFAEGLPVGIMEALARNRPVVATYVAGITELIENRKNGWLVPMANSEALTDALREVINTPVEKLFDMGSVGMERVKMLHSIETEVNKLENLFIKIQDNG